MKPLVIVTLAGALLVVFALGIGAGVWFGQHYRIVSVDAPVDQTAAALKTVADQYTPLSAVPAEPVPRPMDSDFSEILNTPVPHRGAAAGNGPFSYQFVPGETDHYGIEANIQGTGIDLGQGSNIDMNFGSRMALHTDSVDQAGAGNLGLTFDNVDMTGEFMGSPIELHQRPDGTQLKMNSKTKIDSSQGISLGLIPSLEFFKQTIRMTVAKNGEIQKLSGAEGFEQMLSPMTKLAPNATETSGLRPNAQWTSEFLMPVPGLGKGVKTVTRNTFTGYATVDGRKCAVVQQVMDSSQTNGTLSAQSGGLDELLSFAMPLFSVVGRNTIYFDVANGKLVRSDLGLEFNLQIGQQLKPLTDLMKTYGDVLGDVLGDNPGKARSKPSTRSKDSQDMGVKITGTLKLEE